MPSWEINPIKVDECAFYCGKSLYILYTGNYILSRPDEDEDRNIVSDIKASGMCITKEGDIEEFLGTNLDKVDSNIYHISQPQFINQIVTGLDFHSLTQLKGLRQPSLQTYWEIFGVRKSWTNTSTIVALYASLTIYKRVVYQTLSMQCTNVHNFQRISKNHMLRLSRG